MPIPSRRTLSIACTLVLLLCVASCTAMAPFGATPAACTTDGQGSATESVDCDNPNCHGFEVCRLQLGVDAPAGDDTTVVATDDAAVGDPRTPVNAVPDAGTHAQDASPGDDRSMTTSDAGTDPVTCDPECGINEFCNAGLCEEVATMSSGSFELKVLSATIPDRTAIQQCHDVTCDGRFSIPFAVCSCPPSAYVSVLHSRQGVSVLVGATDLGDPSLSPTFSATFNVDLEPGDLLIFEVYDSDEPAADTLLYACSPNLTAASLGPISCSTVAGPSETHGVTAELIQN